MDWALTPEKRSQPIELCYSLLDVVTQHLGESCVCEGGELVQGGLVMGDPVRVGVGGVGNTRIFLHTKLEKSEFLFSHSFHFQRISM